MSSSKRHGFIVPLAILAVFILSSCTTDTPSTDHPLSQHEDDHQHHEDELLVLNPPANYESSLPAMGMSLIDITHMDGLGIQLYHLRIENGSHPFEARLAHRKRHPGVTVDVHHHFEGHAKESRQVLYQSARRQLE